MCTKKDENTNPTENLVFQKLVTDNIPDLIFVKDEQFRIVSCNPAFLTLYPEHKRDKVIGYTTLEDYSEDEAELFLGHDKAAFETGYSETEETITFPSGKTRTLYTKKVRFENEAGEKFILGIGRDITELKQIQAELEEFAYRASHDLRSPLISSLGLINLAQESINKDDDDKAIGYLDLVSQSLNMLQTRVKDILLLTEVRNKDEDASEIDVEALVDECLQNLSQLGGFQDIKIKTTYAHKGKIYAAYSRLTLIIENLVSNAVKYADSNEKNPFIKISAEEDGSFLVFKVEDNGIGIPQERQSEMFKMFKRFHPDRSYGSGLGLYMIRKSAEILGGTISYKTLDKGSLFVLRIPKKAEQHLKDVG